MGTICDLSVKGIARRYEKKESGSFSVLDTFFKKRDSNWNESLRAELTSLARKNRRFRLWAMRVSFEQKWLRIVVRVKLDPDKDVGNLDAQKTRWTEGGIDEYWNGSWAWMCTRPGKELPCRLHFDLQFVDNDYHYKVRVRKYEDCKDDEGKMGNCRSRMLKWDTEDTGSTAAHEFGHMIGLDDEYEEKGHPNRSPVNTGTIMDNDSHYIPKRLVEDFAEHIDSQLVPYDWYDIYHIPY